MVSARIEAAIAFTSNVDTAEKSMDTQATRLRLRQRVFGTNYGTLPTTEAAIAAQKNAAIANVDANIAAPIGGGSGDGAGSVCLTSSAFYYGDVIGS